MERLTQEQAASLVKLILVSLVLLALVVLYVGYSSYTGRDTVLQAARQGCERSKLDRKANASFQTAHVKYINKVTGAASVKEDVKSAAREAIVIFRQTSAGLRKRARIDCKKQFPKVGFP